MLRIVDVIPNGALLQISDPPILARVVGECFAGAALTVRLIEADIAGRSVRFQVVEGRR